MCRECRKKCHNKNGLTFIYLSIYLWNLYLGNFGHFGQFQKIDIILRIPSILWLLPTFCCCVSYAAPIGSLLCSCNDKVVWLHYIYVCHHTMYALILDWPRVQTYLSTSYLRCRYCWCHLLSVCPHGSLPFAWWSMKDICRSFLSSCIAHGCMSLNPMIQMVNRCVSQNVTIVLRWLYAWVVCLVRCMGLMWSLFFNRHLCSSGIWKGLYLRRATEQIMHYNEIGLCTPKFYVMHFNYSILDIHWDNWLFVFKYEM